MTSGGGNTRKDILFYSNFCEYSNDVLNTIIRKNVTPEFMLVCIDSNKYSLPSFVDRVPLIFTKEGRVLMDDDIIRYLDELYPSVTEEIMPFSLSAHDYTNPFSFLDGEDVSLAKGYTMLDQENKIMMRPEMTSGKGQDEESKKSKFDSAVLDKFVAARDSDLQNFKKMYDPGVTSFAR